MKTITTAFKNAWLNRGKKFAVRQIKYKRRYWNGAAFVYEASWQTLKMKDFSQIGTLTQQLDTVKKNEFKVSNITLSLNNRDGRWFPDCTNSVYAADAVATAGYQPYKTLFQVLAGYELADGTEELLTLFTGLLVDYNLSSLSDHIEYTVIGYEEKLLKADAQLVSTAFTNEALTPAPDGVIKDFYTTSLGVGRITSVRADTTVKSEGTHYTISQLNEYGVGAKISFAAAPAGGVALDASGRKWGTLSKIEDLIAGLCEQAGITSGERSIDSVLFPNGVNASQKINDTAEWNAGTLTNITSAVTADAISKKWMATSGASISTTPAIQTIRLNGTFTSAGGYAYIFVRKNDPYSPNAFYALYLGGGEIRFGRVDSFGGVTANLGTIVAYPGAGDHEYRVERDEATGAWLIYYDNVLKLSVTDNTWTGVPAVGANYAGGSSCAASSIYVSPAKCAADAFDGASTAVYESAEFDLGSVPTAWGTLDSIVTLNGGTVSFATNVRTGAGAWDGWVNTGAPDGLGGYDGNAGQIHSALKQKLKIQVTITQAASAIVSPYVSEVSANFTTTTIYIALANYTAMTVYAAIQKLAKLCNYEWGFEGDGTFFFRSKAATSTPVIVLDQKDIQSVPSYKPGWPDVVNAGQVYYGDAGQYYKEYNSSSLPETAPTSKDIYGEAIQSDNASDFLLAFDADLATGSVQLIHDDNYRAKPKIKLICRLIPHLEISDTISATFIQDPLKKEYVFGDPLQKFGVGSIPDTSLILNGKILKVLNHSQRFADQVSELTTEAIL